MVNQIKWVVGSLWWGIGEGGRWQDSSTGRRASVDPDKNTSSETDVALRCYSGGTDGWDVSIISGWDGLKYGVMKSGRNIVKVKVEEHQVSFCQ